MSYRLPDTYTLPDDVCPICCERLAEVVDVARLGCGHFFCFQCLKDEGASFYADSDERPTGTRTLLKLFPCPTCRLGCHLVERIKRRSEPSELVTDPLDGPWREVTVTQAGDIGDETWLATYYSPHAFWDDFMGLNNTRCVDVLQERLVWFQRIAVVTRRDLAESWEKMAVTGMRKWTQLKIRSTADQRREAVADFFKWDVGAETMRADLRHIEAGLSACRERIRRLSGSKDRSGESAEPFSVGDEVWVCGLAKRPEYNGLPGSVEEVLPPRTQDNKTDVTRYKVALSVGGIVLSLRKENIHIVDFKMSASELDQLRDFMGTLKLDPTSSPPADPDNSLGRRTQQSDDRSPSGVKQQLTSTNNVKHVLNRLDKRTICPATKPHVQKPPMTPPADRRA
ncbi:unnamed protein product [Vitrella brassicaformis CCMP3155]|uniref:RING-type domain-containing protein n=2 Tax=Vitrella brassicaformis TaxID=1169539 RepID=A0A0G4EFV8_VITBC|nr:unnamed protein product [Vitrella brassicaformis CCMP3155]|eukprot:CEL94362.1 unnamed protein product [Vitrella brassicaformis CCMP3155]